VTINEIVILMSLAEASVVIGVLTFYLITKSKFDTKYKEDSELSFALVDKAEAYKISNNSVMAETNVVSMIDYRARKMAEEIPLTSKVIGKETRIIYPLKNL